MRPEGVGQAECPGGIKFLLVSLGDDVRMQVLLTVLVNTRYDNDGPNSNSSLNRSFSICRRTSLILPVALSAIIASLRTHRYSASLH